MIPPPDNLDEKQTRQEIIDEMLRVTGRAVDGKSKIVGKRIEQHSCQFEEINVHSIKVCTEILRCF